jgi:FlaA1/EpsC-like NDP-sugar epimerase
MAQKHGIECLVLVSTDKAVRPTNVMGASKRITEIMLQSCKKNGGRFMAVRFGNVVGSSGSVIPIFRRQIERGGPVTVTHPDVTRYFMTIPEAVQLIIQAGAIGRGGEVFILEMGTPVKIADMARDLIRLSGKEPDKDIQIVYTGLREGEKLYEELITVGEGIVATNHEKIMVLRPNGQDTATGDASSREALNAKLESLYDAARRHDARDIKRMLQQIVPEYKPQEAEIIL